VIRTIQRLTHRRETSKPGWFLHALAPAVALALSLAACATSRDTRTPAELERDAEIWTRAHGLRVITAVDQAQGCTSLGIVSERYFEDPPSDPLKRPAARDWPERILRYKTATLGGDTAYLCPTIRKWSGELTESRVLGEAYRCRQTVIATAAQ
jgi:hypothetical protein